MILLDFDAASFPQLRSSESPADVGPWNAFRFVPVLLHAGGIDLIADDADADRAIVTNGLGLPLPEVALWGLVALHHVYRARRSAYELNEHATALLFQLSGNVLLVHSLRRGRTVQVPYDRLLAVWEDFDRRARAFLGQTFGQLVDYPWWNASMDRWLHGTMNIAAMEPPWASMRFLDSCDGCFDRIDAVES